MLMQTQPYDQGFNALDYVSNLKNKEKQLEKTDEGRGQEKFEQLCNKIKQAFRDKYEKENNKLELLAEKEKNAILGKKEEVDLFKMDIAQLLKEWGEEDIYYPTIYHNLVDAIFHELWGYTCLTPWIEGYTQELKESSSCKVIGDKVYFMLNGKLKEQCYRIPEGRRVQLVNALLADYPKKKVQYMTEGNAEVYLLDGTRITLYGEGKVKRGQDSIVFRKFIVKDYTFKKQAEHGTIPEESIPLFESMVPCNFNAAFLGAVRTAKTTFLTTWKTYENKEMERIVIETDPEIPFHEISEGPIMQFVVDDEELKTIMKPLMRGDADSITMAEARDGVALYIALKSANKGTRGVTMSYHSTDILDFCYDVADDIRISMGGSVDIFIPKVAKSFQFIFQFIQLQDKSKKRLKSIYAMDLDKKTGDICMRPICMYDCEKDNWRWQRELFPIHEVIGNEENKEQYNKVLDQLAYLSEKYPMKDEEKEIHYISTIRGRGGVR